VVQAVTDTNGGFRLVALLLGGEPTGPRTISVTDDANRLGTPITIPLLVTARPLQPNGALTVLNNPAVVVRS